MTKGINEDYRPKAVEQRRKRIRLAVCAYAYEIEDDPIVDDATFDALCEEIDVSITTGNPKMDEWFKKEFDPSTGQWIHAHPELDGIVSIYALVRKKIWLRRRNEDRHYVGPAHVQNGKNRRNPLGL